MQTDVGTGVKIREVRFASSQAEVAARELGISIGDVAHLAGPRGVTLAQVRDFAR
jgi:hypothetical protein